MGRKNSITAAPPRLMRDSAFWAILSTQFLGAFNDNLFKQVMLLSLVVPGKDEQASAMALFSAPFVLFSGFAGVLSDRYSKRNVILLAKLAEVCLMTCAACAFYWNSKPALLAILFLMGVHSSFFGPAKYGVLPEMFHATDLPRANGWILMTTFLAIIFGTALAGQLHEHLAGRLWISGMVCIGVAMIGTLTALPIRKVAAAQPGLKLTWSSWFIDGATWRAIRSDRSLLGVLTMSSVFWLVSGMVYPAAINNLGKDQFQLGDARTGLLSACTGVGIAVGCVFAGRLCHRAVRGTLVRVGAWGICAVLFVLAAPGPNSGTLLGPGGSAIFLLLMGVFAGLYSVPLQVYLQYRAPQEQKGRLIGALNLFNWVAIFAAAGVYQLWVSVAAGFGLRQPIGFAVAGLILLPVAIFYRPPSVEMSDGG